jgi:glucose-6-phosphate 1-dehydrogenase
LIPCELGELELCALRAQYHDYRTHEHIPDTSETETYFELKTEIGLPEWEGVPFYIRSGKALRESEVSILVQFKDTLRCMFEADDCRESSNTIKLTISPEQVIEITLNAKAPGLGYRLEKRTLRFVCEQGDTEIKIPTRKYSMIQLSVTARFYHHKGGSRRLEIYHSYRRAVAGLTPSHLPKRIQRTRRDDYSVIKNVCKKN